MTLFYPDVSSFQAGISLAGAPAVCSKVTEGTNYLNPEFRVIQAQASRLGIPFFAYHFLRAGNPTGQARWCLQAAEKTPLMLDFEPSVSSSPTLADAKTFVDDYRALGGTCYLVYLPQWYWQQIGSPSLLPLKNRGLHLVSSHYTTYSDTGPGWQAYGGMTPVIWQFTNIHPFNGFQIDFNAFKGTPAQLHSLVTTGKTTPPKPRPRKVPLLEETMEHIPASGKLTVAIPEGTKHLRFASAAPAKAPAKFHVDWWSSDPNDSGEAFYKNSCDIAVPGGRGAVIHRDDAGGDDLSMSFSA
ncbi:MAG: hypothetical protein J2P30_00560 [Actinobacteria bacterium]|nr:hypothetical protein [Actinomycetota bacterium]